MVLGVVVEYVDVGFVQGWVQCVILVVVLLIDQLCGVVVDGVEDCLWIYVVWGWWQIEFLCVVYCSGVDFEKFVQVGVGNVQELQVFQQWYLGIQCLG